MLEWKVSLITIFPSYQVKESEDELLQELISNRATQPAAIYYMLAARLAR